MTKNERFTDIYNKYGNLVFQYAMKRIANEDLAREFVQQVFTSFYVHMDTIKSDVEKPWLLVCCKNEIIDYLRRPEIKNHFEDIDDPDIEVEIRSEDNTERVVERILKEDLSIRILGALRRKNKSWYEIVEMISVLEMSQEEAAEYLGISPEVLRAKLYRARKYIRKKFGNNYQDI